MSKIKVMAIAPYEGLKELLLKTRARYMEQMDIDVVVGDLREGLTQGRAAEAGGYDIIISRGGTAEMLSQHVSIPVVNIEVSGYDFLRAIATAQNFVGNKAIVGFSYITENAKSVNDLMQTDIRIFTIQNQDEVVPLLRKLTADDKYALIIGDVVTERVASEMGLNGMLLTSGEESVDSAFQTALKICRDVDAYRRNSNMFLQVLENSPFHVAIFSEDKTLLFANFDFKDFYNSEPELIKYIENIIFSGKQHVVLETETGHLSISGRLIEVDRKKAVAFYFTEPENAVQPELRGVNYRNIQFMPGASAPFQQAAEFDADILETAVAFSKSDLPILLLGEFGVGKSRMAYSIHRNSANSQKPFITVDCVTATPETWEALVLRREEKYSNLAGATICFEDIDKLPQKYQNSLRRTLLADGAAQRFRYIATSAFDTERLVSQGKLDAKIVSFFSRLTLTLPGMKQNPSDLKSMVSVFIIESNVRTGKQIVSFSDEALALLGQHRFRNHYEELRQIVDHAVVICDKTHIGKEELELVLSARSGAHRLDEGVSFDGTLEEIERRIIEKVLREENGNLSKTADRLGIGRSTLWRKRSGAE